MASFFLVDCAQYLKKGTGHAYLPKNGNLGMVIKMFFSS